MEFAIRVGEKYLNEVRVNSGYCGHATANQNALTGIDVVDHPRWFDALSAGNKVKAVMELMRWGDVPCGKIEIESRRER